MAPKRNWLLKLFWRVHKWLFRVSRGRLGTTLRGMPILLLTTTGRKSGLRRASALMYGHHGHAYTIIASNAGASFHPGWWLNLKADPRAEVLVDGRWLPVQAREAMGAEREQIWTQMGQNYSDYDAYREMTDRQIPVVVLDPR